MIRSWVVKLWEEVIDGRYIRMEIVWIWLVDWILGCEVERIKVILRM